MTGGTFDQGVRTENLFFEIDGVPVAPDELFIDHGREFWSARFNAWGYDTGPHTFAVGDPWGITNEVTFHGWDDPSLGLLDFNLIWPVEGASVYGGFEVFGRRFDQGAVSGAQNVAIEAYGGGELKGGYALSTQVFD